MTKEAKTAILKALFNRTLSTVEAVHLLRTDGVILLDLSKQVIRQNPLQSILEKVPDIQKHFKRIIFLGNGKPLIR